MSHSIKEAGEAGAEQDTTTKSTTSTMASLKRTSRLLSGGSHGVSHLLPPGDLFRVDEDRNSSDGGKYNSNSSSNSNNDRRRRRRKNGKAQDDSGNNEDDEEYDGVDENGDGEENEKGGTEIMVHDENQRLQWSIKFFENLHFDLNPAHREHLHEGIHRYVNIKYFSTCGYLFCLFSVDVCVVSLSLSLSCFVNDMIDYVMLTFSELRHTKPRLSLSFSPSPSLSLSVALSPKLHTFDDSLGRVLFEEHYAKNCRGRTFKNADPKTKEDPGWSPIVDIKEVTVPVSMNNSQEEVHLASVPFPRRRSSLLRKPGDYRHKVGTASSYKTSMSPPTTAKALVVIHRLSYEENGSGMVMGRFLLPVQKGLYEVIVIAADEGPTCDVVPELTMTVSSTSTSSPLALSSIPSNIGSGADDAPLGCRISPDRDDVSWDEQYPDHCLSRVRKALQWLVEKSEMVVSDPPKEIQAALTSSSWITNRAEWDLSHIHCRITPPERFLPCPNPDNPESNKYRFCRSTLGGTVVEMMVVSCWYGAEIPKGSIKHLRKLAVHASKVIHESQQLFDVRVSVKEVALGQYRQKDNVRCLPFHVVSHPKDGIITTVDCIDAQGRRKQNTIGWVRESVSGNVYLVYFVDTLRSDPKVVRQDLATTLASVRVPRLIPNSVRKKLAWHVTSSPALLQPH